MKKLIYSIAAVSILFSCAGEDPDAAEGGEGSEGSVDSTALVEEEVFDYESYEDEGAKMYVTTNDRNARKHFVRELGQYNHWQLMDSREEADFEIFLYEKQKKLDRKVWIDIKAIEADSVVYTSPTAKAVKKGLRTFNFKEQAVKNLVHDILAPKFFN